MPHVGHLQSRGKHKPSAKLGWTTWLLVLLAGLFPGWRQTSAQEPPTVPIAEVAEGQGKAKAAAQELPAGPAPETPEGQKTEASAQELQLPADVIEETVQGQIPVPTSEPPLSFSEDQYINDDFWTRPTLTGDWFGLRSTLQESGVTFAIQETQFAYGIAGGINRLVPFSLGGASLGLGNTFNYTGVGQYNAILDLDKLIGLPRGTLAIRFDDWYGQYSNVSLRAGTFAPPAFAALLPPRPNQPGDPFFTQFLWTQPLSQSLVVYAGKKVMIGAFDQDIFAGGNGTQQFSNQSLVANPAFLLGMPYSSFIAGFVSPQKWGRFGAFVLDPVDRTADFFSLGNLFPQGVILGTEARLNTNFFNMRGEQHVGGLWKHHEQTDLRFQEPPPGVFPEPTVPGFPTLDNSYTLYYGFDQYLVQFPDSKRGWGMFGRAALTDGNPNPVQYFLSCGIGGYSPFRKRWGDRFGIGWYLNGASDQFGRLPRLLFGPQNGTGVELYYNFQLTGWLNFTPDIQFIHPGATAISTENAFIYGIRLGANF
jgi:porin